MTKSFVYTMAIMFLGSAILWAKSAESGKYDQGKKLFNNKCQICHGLKGDGKGPAAASFSPRPADFTNPNFWQNNVDQKIADTIKNGHGVMPAFDMKPDEIQAIIDYMDHTFKKNNN